MPAESVQRNIDDDGTIRRAMTKLEALEREVEKLTQEELSVFREWFIEYDWQAWDRELEQDAASGKLDEFAAEALEEFEHVKTKEFESPGERALLASL